MRGGLMNQARCDVNLEVRERRGAVRSAALSLESTACRSSNGFDGMR